MATKKRTAKKSPAKKAAPKKSSLKPKKPVVKKKQAKKPVRKKAASKKKTAAAPTSRHIISYNKAMMMKAAYMEAIKTPGAGIIKFNDGREFDKSLFEVLLSMEGVDRIRIYNALNENNEHTFVITAVNSQNFNIPVPVTQDATQAGAAQAAVGGDNSGGAGNMGDQCTDPQYKPQ